MVELLNTRAIAERLDMPQLEVIRRIRKGDIVAQKFGWIWVAEPQEVEKVLDSEWYKRYQRRRTAA